MQTLNKTDFTITINYPIPEYYEYDDIELSSEQWVDINEHEILLSDELIEKISNIIDMSHRASCYDDNSLFVEYYGAKNIDKLIDYLLKNGSIQDCLEYEEDIEITFYELDFRNKIASLDSIILNLPNNQYIQELLKKENIL